ncbi:hypothetical protein A5682_04225 [Mycobacterium mantenii]|uniref:hypothetical protein n=1 Tax=Mycobacterium mantenii TaxID=560555 RepID=UPI000801DD28|nr:hypothetical protein [Mycobacterium mantenii]OBH52194.1 hypothetical protein A5687_09180 [Mycobacterium mantenii]OBH73759.1 hypothetical protein A5682_04225 [Mycobacterium mantenii]
MGDPAGKTLWLELGNSDGTASLFRVQFFQANIVRFNFFPRGPKDFEMKFLLSSRAIVMDRTSDLQAVLEEDQPFTVEASEHPPTAGV